MTIVMYDSVNPDRIPADAQAVAGYVNGNYVTYPTLEQRWPNAHKVSISISANGDADCLDCETGDASISQAAAWVRRQHARGLARPIVYTSTSNVPALLAALENDGIKRSEFLIWSAHYTGVPHIEPGSDATQYEENAGQDLDYSLCYEEFFGISPTPPKPKPAPPKPDYVPGDEINWVKEWNKIVGRKTIAAHVRRVFLKAQMVHRERQIVALAQKSCWQTLNRKARYDKLFNCTKAR